MVAQRSAVDLQPSINFQTPVENLGPLLETPGTTIPVGTGGLHFISGARRGMNELRLQGRPTVCLNYCGAISFPHHVGTKCAIVKKPPDERRFGRREWTLSCRRACSRHPIDE